MYDGWGVAVEGWRTNIHSLVSPKHITTVEQAARLQAQVMHWTPETNYTNQIF